MVAPAKLARLQAIPFRQTCLPSLFDWTKKARAPGDLVQAFHSVQIVQPSGRKPAFLTMSEGIGSFVLWQIELSRLARYIGHLGLSTCANPTWGTWRSLAFNRSSFGSMEKRYAQDFKTVPGFASRHESDYCVLDPKNRYNSFCAKRSAHRRARDNRKDHYDRQFWCRRSSLEWNAESAGNGSLITRPCGRHPYPRNSVM